MKKVLAIMLAALALFWAQPSSATRAGPPPDCDPGTATVAVHVHALHLTRDR